MILPPWMLKSQEPAALAFLDWFFLGTPPGRTHYPVAAPQ